MSQYQRSQTQIDDNFLIVRNEWVRDQRITGNALSLYLYIRSHSMNFVVTRSKAMTDLGLGKDAYRVAEQRLEQAGYLEIQPPVTIRGVRQPKRYYLVDPWDKAAQARNQPENGEVTVPESALVELTQERRAENPPIDLLPVDNRKAENPPIAQNPVDNSKRRAENPQSEGRKIRPIKEDQLRKQSLSPISVKPVRAEVAVENIRKALRMFDGTEKLPENHLKWLTEKISAHDPRLDAEQIVDEVHRLGVPWLVIAEIDLVRAVQHIAQKSRGVVLRLPNKYFAKAIADAIDSFPKMVFRPEPFQCELGVHKIFRWTEADDVAECHLCGKHVTDRDQKILLAELSQKYDYRQLKGVI